VSQKEGCDLVWNCKLTTRVCGATGYVIQLITLSNLVARRRKATQVDVPDVRRVYTLCVPSPPLPLFAVLTRRLNAYRFLDEKRSVQFLKEQNSLLIGEDGQVGAGAAGDAMEVA
jgi:RuvB-like protein 2